MIEYQRVELPVKKQSVLEWLERETRQWVQSNGLVQYHVPTNDALYSIQAQRPSVDWRAGIVRVAQVYTIETNDDRPMQVYGLEHGGLDLLIFEVIELPNGLVRITARCNDFDRTGKAGHWFFNVLDNLWAEMLRVCSPLHVQPDTIRAVLEENERRLPLGLALFKAASDVVTCASRNGGIMPPVTALSPVEKGSRIIMGYALSLVSAGSFGKEEFGSDLSDYILPEFAASFLREFPTITSATTSLGRLVSLSGVNNDALATAEQVLNLTVEEARVLLFAKPLVMQFRETLLSRSGQVAGSDARHSGGANVEAGRDVTIGGDVVGRDKIIQATTYIEHAIYIQPDHTNSQKDEMH